MDPSEHALRTVAEAAAADPELALELAVAPRAALSRLKTFLTPEDHQALLRQSDGLPDVIHRGPAISLQYQNGLPSIGPEYAERGGPEKHAETLQQKMTHAPHPMVPPMHPIEPSGTFDIEIWRESDRSAVFGAWLGTDWNEPLSTERVYLEKDLDLIGPAAHTPLSQSAMQPGVQLFFRAPLLSSTTATPPGATAPLTFVSDAELQVLTHDPNTLYEMLLGATDQDWPAVVSTLRGEPRGEDAENPLPFQIPAVLALPARESSTAYGAIAPVLSHYFSLTNPHNDERWPAPAWAPAPRRPSGTGSVKALRFIQHGPCDIDISLQPLLNAAKVSLVASLNACGSSVAGFSLNDLQINSFNMVPYVTRADAGVPMSPFQLGQGGEAVSGLLLHGDILIDIGMPVVATTPCVIRFVVDYRLAVEHGLVSVIPTIIRYESYGGTGIRGLIDQLMLTGVKDFALDVLGVNSFSLGPGQTASIGDAFLTVTIPKQIAGAASAQQAVDVSPIVVRISEPATKCHKADDPNGPMSCAAAANALLAEVIAGATAFLGRGLTGPETAAILHTITLGQDLPDSDGWLYGFTNWHCDADTSSETADQRASKPCKFVARAKRVAAIFDQLSVTPFFEFDDWRNSSLLLFYALFNVGIASVPMLGLNPGDPFLKLICNRFPLSSLQPPRPSVSFFNRWYSSININGLGCGGHQPARLVAGCNQDSDCPNFGRCTNGRCEVGLLESCGSNRDCYPWESCQFDFSANPPTSRCLPIPVPGPCDSYWDPFQTKGVGTGCFPGSFCNNFECWRI